MLHAHKFEPAEEERGRVVAFPAPEFGRKPAREPFRLVVDLANEPLGPKWWRGAATLAALCGTVLLLSPGLPSFGGAPAEPVQIQSGEPQMLSLPQLGGEPVVAPADAVPEQRGLAVGERGSLKRVSGDVSGGLYWSLREAGASPQVATDYLKAIAGEIDVGEVAPYDRFDFVVDTTDNHLLFARLVRAQGSDVELMRWTAGGRAGWFGGVQAEDSSSGFMAPVAGRISSRFGRRVHPILRYARMHSGVDFAAGYGSPVAAAADGQVVGAGRAGGYGRQVRVAHGNGVVTTYSHLSGFAAAPGAPVRQGQVIGYVGSSGVSTGAHLHFEVRVNGRAVDPLSARLVQRPVMSEREMAAFKARMAELRAIPVEPV